MSCAVRVLLVTGGTGSIGREVAAQALAAGWSVIIQGSRPDTVAVGVAGLLNAQRDSALRGLVADIRSEGAAEKMIADAAAIWGRIDAIVDCLVTGPSHAKVVGSFAETDPTAYLALMELSVVYLQRMALAALPWLRASGGCLVTFVSDAALYAAPRQALIGATRAAAIGFIRNFAMDVARDGVRAHCISPSFVLETMTAERIASAASGRLDSARRKAGLGLPTPADIAPLALFLCGDGARRMTGQVISINGGLHA